MAASLPTNVITFGSELVSVGRDKLTFLQDVADVDVPRLGPVISTMPMPKLMDVLEYKEERPVFKYRSGFTVRFDVATANVNATCYLPSPHVNPYRASINGSTVMIEYACEPWADDQTVIDDAVETAVDFLGIDEADISSVKIHLAHYAKISPVDEEKRRRFIVWASMNHNVYSLGRFATWRPGLLMDDVVNDIRVIERLMSGQNVYEHLLRG
jgi:hypothetical protein